MATFLKTETVPQQKQAETPRGKIVIAVDGPAASGKGTLAKMLAERLGYAYLDTGALYRAVGLMTLEMGGDVARQEDALRAVEVVKNNLTPELLANPVLRSHEISEAASVVATHPGVRIELIDFQRNFAANPPGNVGGAVLDGRDIGTVICPNANVKFFVTAAPETRARRRLSDLKKEYPQMTEETVLQDIRQRDQRDTLRKAAPAIPANDAHVLDTTSLTPSEGLDEAVAIMKSKFLVETEV